MGSERPAEKDDIRIRTHPDPVLRKKSSPVEAITEQERGLFDKMLSIMRSSKGLGLAAPQVGILRQLIVADVEDNVVKLANPVMLRTRGKEKMEEGCLSVPGESIVVERACEIVVGGLDEKGRRVEVRTTGLLARVLQHEMDHLKGRLILDYVGFWERVKSFFSLKKTKGE